jgi:hypothetical protein
MKSSKFRASLLRRAGWSCLLIASAPLSHAGLSSDLAEMRKAHRAYLQHFLPSLPDDGKPRQITPPAWDNAATKDQCRVAWSEVEAFLDKAEAAHSKSRDYQLTASAGFGGDSAGSSERSKASIESELKAGIYPGQFRMKAGASLDFKSDASGQSLTEDVTSILINYDHYIHPNWEGFAFMERFTDSYMQIDQRYEVGPGIKFEWRTGKNAVLARMAKRSAESSRNPKPHAPDANLLKGIKAEDLAMATAKLLETLEGDKVRGCLLNQALKPLEVPKPVDDPRGNDNPLYQALLRDTTVFEVGISLAALAEFEQSDTLTFMASIAGAPAEQHTAKPGMRRYRWSLRPSFNWNIAEDVKLFGQFYYKPAIDKPREIGGKRDYRVDILTGMEWQFATIKPDSDKKIAVAFTYEWHYDSTPPNASAAIAQLAANAAVPVSAISTTGQIAARKRHSITKLSLKVAL